MPSEPQDPWGCSCSIMIEGDFVPKGVKQFGRSSQDLDLEYKKYLVLVEKKKGGVRGTLGRNLRAFCKNWRNCCRMSQPYFGQVWG